MRIALINMLHVGSTGKIMFGIATIARQHGHIVQTFSPRYYQRSGKAVFPEIEGHQYFGSTFENMLHHYIAKISGFHGFFSWLGTLQLLNMLDKFQPDIIHLHNIHNKTICVPMLFAYIKKKGIRIIWTLHDCWSFTGQCAHFSMAKCDKWKTQCGHCRQIHTYPDALVDRTKLMWKLKRKWFTGIESMTLVTPSHWLANLTSQSFVGIYPIITINNGIDLNTFFSRENNFREAYKLLNKHVLLGVAYAWGKRKGLDVFIDLAKRLDEAYQIVLVGTNADVDAYLPKNILSIHQTKNQQQLAEIYSAADLFVNPTREENYPTVNMESIACGTPVLTFRTGGSPEILTSETGAVVDCDDIDSMEREIRRICEMRPFKREDCVKAAQAFDMQSRFEEYVRLYEDHPYRA